MDRRFVYAIAAAVVPAGAAAFELGRIVTNNPWNGLEAWISHTASALLATLFLCTSLALVLSRRDDRAGEPARLLAMATPLFMFFHAFVTRVAGTPAGLLYVLAAAIVAFCARQALWHEPAADRERRSPRFARRATAG